MQTFTRKPHPQKGIVISDFGKGLMGTIHRILQRYMRFVVKTNGREFIIDITLFLIISCASFLLENMDFSNMII